MNRIVHSISPSRWLRKLVRHNHPLRAISIFLNPLQIQRGMRCLSLLAPSLRFPLTLTPIRTLIAPPSPAYYTHLLETCILSKSLNHGRLLHQHLLKTSAISAAHPLILEKLAKFYAACGKIAAACKVFDEIPSPSVVLCNWLIRSYAWIGPFYHALDLYSHMLEIGILPTNYTFPFVLKACSALSDVESGEKIHGQVIKLGFDRDTYVSTALLDLYAKCGCLVAAERVFDRMDSKDVVAWNAMVAGFSLHGGYDNAVKLVKEMFCTGLRPNLSTLVGILPVVAQFGNLKAGRSIHGYCVRLGFSSSVVVGTGLLDMYAKCGCFLYAKMIFDLLRIRNEVTWSAMIGAYVNADCMREALELFSNVLASDRGILSAVMIGCALRACTKLMDLSAGRQIHCYMVKSGSVDDLFVGNTLISTYSKCCSVTDAVQFFEGMNLKDRVSYNAMISGFVQNGKAQEGLGFFRVMQRARLVPDEATMLAILPAFSQLGALQLGSCAHGYAMVFGLIDNVSICNALIDMYAKCGKLETSRKIFDGMVERDIISWNSIIAGYGSNGFGSEALKLFDELVTRDLKPDEVTFISLLIACSHSGLVNEGKHWFNAMVQKFSIVPRIDHYICMVDLLARAGNLEEAKDFINQMPLEPDADVWSVLLSACRVHKNIELGEEAAKKIHDLGPRGTMNFVMLSNIYSSAGRFEDAACVRVRQRDGGFRKSPGCSWIEVDGSVHGFVGGDRSHPRSAEIFAKLEGLLIEIRKLGYRPVPGFVMQDVEEEEEEWILLHHSEKLAIAFALIVSGPTRPIFVTKNLRVCGDCHEAIKFISLLEKREICVRDASRFHHFRDGVCSCGDFW